MTAGTKSYPRAERVEGACPARLIQLLRSYVQKPHENGFLDAHGSLILEHSHGSCLISAGITASQQHEHTSVLARSGCAKLCMMSAFK